jgi:hypothetical protein
VHTHRLARLPSLGDSCQMVEMGLTVIRCWTEPRIAYSGTNGCVQADGRPHPLPAEPPQRPQERVASPAACSVPRWGGRRPPSAAPEPRTPDRRGVTSLPRSGRVANPHGRDTYREDRRSELAVVDVLRVERYRVGKRTRTGSRIRWLREHAHGRTQLRSHRVGSADGELGVRED